MIANLDRTIEKLLIAEVPIENGKIDVKFEQPTREWSARLSRPTINLFLYDVRENNVLRQPQWERVVRQDGRTIPRSIAQKRTPFRVDCHYILTTWAPEVQDEHTLLSRAMLALFRNPVLPDKYLVDELNEQPFKLMAQLARHDKLINPAELWGAMDNVIRPSVSYIITLSMDPWTPVTSPIVLSYTLTEGQADKLPRTHTLTEGTAVSQITIGGIVRQDGRPQPGLQTAIKGTGCFATTNDDGRYILANVPLGEHTFIVWTKNDKPIERQIVIPSDNYDIDL